MHQFFVDASQISGNTIRIIGDDVNHIRNVLRIKPGEEFNIYENGSNIEYRCEIASFEEDEVMCSVRFKKESDVELTSRIYLFQGLPKADKMELIIQKAVELGAYEIVPVAMSRSVVKLDESKSDKKVARWNLIAEAAAKQSKRAFIPTVHSVMNYKDAVEYAKTLDINIMPYELCDSSTMNETRNIFENIKPGQSVGIFIGPEGGFSDEEAKYAVDEGFHSVTLGRRILRTETAGFTVLSWLVYLLEK